MEMWYSVKTKNVLSVICFVSFALFVSYSFLTWVNVVDFGWKFGIGLWFYVVSLEFGQKEK